MSGGKHERGIRVSMKHGVNPSIGVCFWCGQDSGEVLLLGRLPNDAEAPRRATYHYEPCPECAATFKKGIVIIEGVRTPLKENQLELADGVYPTGRLMVISERLARVVFRQMPDRLAQILRARRCVVDTPVMNNFFELQRKQEKEQC